MGGSGDSEQGDEYKKNHSPSIHQQVVEETPALLTVSGLNNQEVCKESAGRWVLDLQFNMLWIRSLGKHVKAWSPSLWMLTAKPELRSTELLHDVPVVVIGQPSLSSGMLSMLIGWGEARGEAAVCCRGSRSAFLQRWKLKSATQLTTA